MEASDKFESILNQSPEGITIEQGKELYEKLNGNTVEILSELWNIDSSYIKNQAYDEKKKEKEKWNNIREICNAYEEEMDKYMKNQVSNKKSNNNVKLPLDNIIENE